MHDSEKHSRPGNRYTALILVLFLLAIYLATAALRFQSIDEIAVFTVARSLVGRGTFDTDAVFWGGLYAGRFSSIAPGVDGHMYSVKDVAPSIAAVPMVWLAHLLGVSPIRAALMSSIIVTALTAGLLYHTVIVWGYGRRTAILGALAYGLTTMAWPYTKVLFTQPLAAFGLLAATWGIIWARGRDRWWAAFIGGLGLGIAGGSSAGLWIAGPACVLYLVPWGLLIQRRGTMPPVELARAPTAGPVLQKSLLSVMAFLAGAGLCLLALGAYNAVRFGSPFRTGYHAMGALQFTWLYLVVGSIGQLVSLPRGVIWYAPSVLLVIPGLMLGWRDHRREHLLLIGQMAPAFLLFSGYVVWWGGLAWGPRLLVALMPPLTLLAVPALDRLLRPGRLWKRLLAGGLLALSGLVQLGAALVNVIESEIPIFRILSRYDSASLVAESFALFTDPAMHPFTRIAAALRAGDWDVLWMTQRGFDGLFLLAHVVVIAVAGFLLVRAWRERPARAQAGWAAALGLLCLALMALALFRYPQASEDMRVEQPPPPPELSDAIAAITVQAAPGDGVLVILPYSYLGWLDHFDGSLPELGLLFENPLDARTEAMLARFGGWHPRVWVVTEATVAGDPANQTDRWLAEHGFVGPETWVGGYRLVPYTFTAAPRPCQATEAAWVGDVVALVGYDYEQVTRGATRWLNVHLCWDALAPPGMDYTVFVHVIGPDGRVAAQHDGPPMAGYAPTSVWMPGHPIDDRHAVLLPPDLAPGAYRLQVGLYDPFTGERLPVDGNNAGAFVLDVVTIE
jgi:hypothetical protein